MEGNEKEIWIDQFALHLQVLIQLIELSGSDNQITGACWTETYHQFYINIELMNSKWWHLRYGKHRFSFSTPPFKCPQCWTTVETTVVHKINLLVSIIHICCRCCCRWWYIFLFYFFQLLFSRSRLLNNIATSIFASKTCAICNLNKLSFVDFKIRCATKTDIQHRMKQ